MSELRHDAFVHLDIPALAQIPRLAERPDFGGSRTVLDCDYCPYGRHRVAWRDGHAPDNSPAMAGEQPQFGTALRVNAGHDSGDRRVRLVFGVSDKVCIHGRWVRISRPTEGRPPSDIYNASANVVAPFNGHGRFGL